MSPGARRAAPLTACLLLAACGAQPAPGTAPAQAAPAATGTARHLVPDGYDGPLGAVGLVLDDGDGPELCFSVAQSLPPQCGGIPLRGWDWAALEPGSYEDVSGSRFGDFLVVGTAAGDGDDLVLTLTQPPRPPGEAEAVLGPSEPAGIDFGTPCPEPPGGWRPVDAARATDTALQEGAARAAALPEHGAVWIDQGTDLPDEPVPLAPPGVVLNVTTTGEPAAVEAAVREVWGGALCVSAARRTAAELERIQREAEALVDGHGWTDVRSEQVLVQGTLARASQQRELDERFGPGAVRLVSSLVPVPG